MKRIIVASIALMAASLAVADLGAKEKSVVGSQCADGAAATGSGSHMSHFLNDKERVLEMVHRYTQSVNEGDIHPELIEELWEHSPEVSNVNIRGHQKGFEDIKRNFYAPIFLVLKDRNLRVVTGEHNPAVYIFDNTAVVEFYWKLNATLKEGNKAVSAAGRETHVYRKECGVWKLVHLHYSGMAVPGF
jgi:ketosteroid isomerase-like protein